MTDYTSKTLQELVDLDSTDNVMESERLNAIKKAILAEGDLDAFKVGIIEKVIYSAKISSDCALTREKIEFLFAINNAINNDDEDNRLWQTLFIEAVTAHILNDKESPGVIDVEEATWLIDTIEADGGYNMNEVALLNNLMENAVSLPTNIKLRLDMILAAI